MNKTDSSRVEADEEIGDGPGEYRLDDQVGFVLRLASQRHASIFQSLTFDGLTPTQFATLVRIVELGECSQNSLGRQVSMDVATIKGVVDRLKKKGLVQLAPDISDKRRTTITPTETARQMVAALHDLGHRISRETLKPLSARESATLLRLLKKIS